MEVEVLVGFTNEEKTQHLLKNEELTYFTRRSFQGGLILKWLTPYIKGNKFDFEVNLTNENISDFTIEYMDDFKHDVNDLRSARAFIVYVKYYLTQGREVKVRNITMLYGASQSFN